MRYSGEYPQKIQRLMNRSEFNYTLPSDLIAQRPLPQRSSSRLLCLNGESGVVDHRRFTDLPSLLLPDDLLVFNNTRVIPARLWGQKETGGKLEILIERLTGTHTAVAHIRSSKSPKPGSTILVCPLEGASPSVYRLQVTGRQGALFCLSSEGFQSFSEIMQAQGHMPLPPYIAREDEPADQSRYQTVFAERDGAVAAPTAGLHFTDELLSQCDAKGIRRAVVTLHVGAGTF